MTAFLPKFEVVAGPQEPPDTRKVIVFIHGIFSSHETFAFLVNSIGQDPRFQDYYLTVYDYDWGEPIVRSAERLRGILNGRLKGIKAEVTLIGHSMGGLVSRFAVMAGDLPHVRRVIMLGTPNFGAFTASQLSTLLQLAVTATGKLTAFFPRKQGLHDLTRVQSIFEDVTSTNPDFELHASTVEYLTLPGLYYHDDRRDTDPGARGEAAALAGMIVGMRLLPLWGPFEIEIRRPHDGVVEEASVSLVPRQAGRFSEKSLCIQDPAKYGATYGHITPRSVRNRTHMAIQRDETVAEAIKGVLLAGSVVAWKAALSRHERSRYSDIEVPGSA